MVFGKVFLKEKCPLIGEVLKGRDQVVYIYIYVYATLQFPK
jgi:hypothetical protein